MSISRMRVAAFLWVCSTLCWGSVHARLFDFMHLNVGINIPQRTVTIDATVDFFDDTGRISGPLKFRLFAGAPDGSNAGYFVFTGTPAIDVLAAQSQTSYSNVRTPANAPAIRGTFIPPPQGYPRLYVMLVESLPGGSEQIVRMVRVSSGACDIYNPGQGVNCGPSASNPSEFDQVPYRTNPWHSYGDIFPVTPVFEYYHRGLNHYFRTADPAEASGIDAGAAGPGWESTGGEIRTLGLSAPAFVASPVCRFYARGPNSHFYTASKPECDGLKALQTPDAPGQPFLGWQYEGIAFRALLPLLFPNETCPVRTFPVRRFYNQRAAQNDSNHRFTADPAEWARMRASGWFDEGPVFCMGSPADVSLFPAGPAATGGLADWPQLTTSSVDGVPQVEICVSDYECEDGDILSLSLNGFGFMRTELFNTERCKRAIVNPGNNLLTILAVNGTGFKGQCSFADVNTGEVRIYSLAASGTRLGAVSQRWSIRSGQGSVSKVPIRIN